MHPALILAGTTNLDKSSHDFFHSHSFANTNDHHGTSSYVIQHCIIVDQHPLCRELPSTSQRSSSAPIDQHTPFNNFTSSVIPFVSTHTIHEQDKLTYDPYQPPLPSSTMTQSTILTWRGYIDHGNWRSEE